MHKLGAAVAAAGFVFVTGAAQAQVVPSWTDGFYVRGDVGGAVGDATKFHDGNPNAAIPVLMPSTAETETGVSPLVGGGIG
jgi:hypothetical protein